MSDAPQAGGAASGAAAADDPPEPIAVGAAAVHIELPEFEGPLDLLLHLIKKEELEIIDIPISLIAEKYLEYIRIMHTLNLDIAGEYLLMAATLAYLKSRELVPIEADPDADASGDDDDEGGDPRQALIRRLLEYQKYKEAAHFLGERPVMGRNEWPRGAAPGEVAGLPQDEGGALEEVPVFRLIEALEKVLSRARVELTHDVVVERISITDKIGELVDRLAQESPFTFVSCFRFLDAVSHPAEVRHQVVITFLALLEMTRLHMLRIYQASDRGEIYVSRPDLPAPAPPQSEAPSGDV